MKNLPIVIMLLVALLLNAPSGSARQNVTGRFLPEKHNYLVGEPIIVDFEVFNHSNKVGEIVEGGCGDDNTFRVDGATPRKTSVRFSCGPEYTQIICGSGDSDIPAHGRYKKRMPLDGPFVLDSPGTYHVRAYSDQDIELSESDKVLGHLHVESDFDLILRSPKKGELEAAYKPFLKDLGNKDLFKRDFAAEAITRNPPPFADAVIAELTDDPIASGEAIEGLGRSGTPAARAKLIKIASGGSEDNQQAIEVLGELENPDDCQAMLDIGSRTDHYNQELAYMYAARICKDRALPDLIRLLPTANAQLAGGLATALENTSSPGAIPPLIDLLVNPDTSVRADAEEALATLTHRKSQYGTSNAQSSDESRKQWSDWWAINGSSAPIYGPDKCVDPLPLS